MSSIQAGRLDQALIVTDQAEGDDRQVRMDSLGDTCVFVLSFFRYPFTVVASLAILVSTMLPLLSEEKFKQAQKNVPLAEGLLWGLALALYVHYGVKACRSRRAHNFELIDDCADFLKVPTFGATVSIALNASPNVTTASVLYLTQAVWGVLQVKYGTRIHVPLARSWHELASRFEPPDYSAEDVNWFERLLNLVLPGVNVGMFTSTVGYVVRRQVYGYSKPTAAWQQELLLCSIGMVSLCAMFMDRFPKLFQCVFLFSQTANNMALAFMAANGLANLVFMATKFEQTPSASAICYSLFGVVTFLAGLHTALSMKFDHNHNHAINRKVLTVANTLLGKLTACLPTQTTLIQACHRLRLAVSDLTHCLEQGLQELDPCLTRLKQAINLCCHRLCDCLPTASNARRADDALASALNANRPTPAPPT